MKPTHFGRDTQARIAKALELREKEGMTWAAIRDRLGPGAMSAALNVQAARRTGAR